MRRCCTFLAAALAACSGRIEFFHVSPDQEHVLIGNDTSLRSVAVDTNAVVGGASDIYPQWVIFSRGGSTFATRSQQGTIVAAPIAGGPQVDLGPAIDLGLISNDGSRVAFLRSCSADRYSGCANLFSAPSSGGEAVRVGSGLGVGIVNDAGVAESMDDRYGFAGNDTLVFTNDQGLMSVPANGSAAPIVLVPGAPPRFPQGRPIPPIFWVTGDSHVVVQDGAGLLLMSAKGGAALRIADDPSARLLCQVSVDETMDFSCPVSAAGSLALLLPSTESIQVVSLVGGASFTLAGNPLLFDSDGELIFFDPGGFLSAASPSGVVRQIGRPAIKGYGGSRSPDGKWVSSTVGLTGDPCDNCELLQVLSTATATTWDLTSAGKPLPIVGHQFSPDSSSILLQTTDRRLAIVPAAGGEPRFVESDADGASWVGPDHIVVSRTRSSPAGVHITRLR
jgi:hypothetical protein